jgi:hypothetical protein
MLPKTEQVLFETFNNLIIFAELFERFDEDDVVKFEENATATFSTLDPDLLERYREFLKKEIERERARGAFERANILDGLAETFNP